MLTTQGGLCHPQVRACSPARTATAASATVLNQSLLLQARHQRLQAPTKELRLMAPVSFPSPNGCDNVDPQGCPTARPP